MTVGSNFDRVATLDGSARFELWGKTFSDRVTFKEFPGAKMSTTIGERFSKDVPVYPDTNSAYVKKGANSSTWEVPYTEDRIVSLGTLKYQNDFFAPKDFGPNSIGFNFGLRVNNPVETQLDTNFYVEIANNKDAPETIYIGNSGYKQFQMVFSNGKKASPIYFDYLGARKVGENQSTPLKYSFDVADGKTETFELFGRLFVVPKPNPIKITSISDDTGVPGDFRTSDNTLKFGGTAEAGNKVEVFLDGSSIGTTNADAQGKWSYDYTRVKLLDRKYDLTAAATNLFGVVSNTDSPTKLEIDTNYNIELDFTDLRDLQRNKLPVILEV